jgi:hypothetical protein
MLFRELGLRPGRWIGCRHADMPTCRPPLLQFGTTVKGFAPDWMVKILPFEAGSALYAVTPGDTPPWEGGAIFLGWAGLLLLGGAALFNRRNLGSSG